MLSIFLAYLQEISIINFGGGISIICIGILVIFSYAAFVVKHQWFQLYNNLEELLNKELEGHLFHKIRQGTHLDVPQATVFHIEQKGSDLPIPGSLRLYFFIFQQFMIPDIHRLIENEVVNHFFSSEYLCVIIPPTNAE